MRKRFTKFTALILTFALTAQSMTGASYGAALAGEVSEETPRIGAESVGELTETKNEEDDIILQEDEDEDQEDITVEEEYEQACGDIPMACFEHVEAVDDEISFLDAKKDLEGTGDEADADGIAEPVPSAYPAAYDETDALNEYFDTMMPPLRSQKGEGICWAFSNVAQAELYMLRHKDRDLAGEINPESIDYSELFQGYYTYAQNVDPIYGDKGDIVKVEPNENGNQVLLGGSAFLAGSAMAAGIGLADEKCFPYSLASSIINDRNAFNPDYAYSESLVRFRNLIVMNIQNNAAQIKQAVMENGGAGLSYRSDSDNYDSKHNSFYSPNKAVHNHAVTIVGWDDDFPAEFFKDKPEGDGAWLIRNSWFDEKAQPSANRLTNKGYFWLSYYDKTLRSTVTSLEVESEDVTPLNVYRHTAALYVAAMLKMGTYANVFNACVDGEGERLKSIRFWSGGSQSKVKIEIYRNIPEGEGPDKGELVPEATTERVVDFEGLYTIDLDSCVELKPNERFAVVITTDGAVAHEESWAGSQVSANVTIEKGESYYLQGDGWKDFKDYLRSGDLKRGNFCIYALTENMSDDKDRVGGEKIAEKDGTLVARWDSLPLSDGYYLEIADTIVKDPFKKTGSGVIKDTSSALGEAAGGKSYYARVIPVFNGKEAFDRRSRVFAKHVIKESVDAIPVLSKGKTVTTLMPVVFAAKDETSDGILFEYRSSKGGDWNVLPTHTASSAHYILMDSLPVGEYDIRARYFVCGQYKDPVMGAYSDILKVRLYAAPEDFAVTYDESSGKVAMSWKAVEGADRYMLYKDGTKLGYVKNTSLTLSANIVPGTQYLFEVYGYDSTKGSSVEYYFARRAYASVFTAKGCLITFDTDGGSDVYSTYQKYGEVPVMPEDPVKEGYEFEGWYLNGEKYDADKPLINDIALKAHWSGAYNHYKVKHYMQGFDGEYYLAKTERGKGEKGAVLTPPVMVTEGFRSPEAKSAVIGEDESTILKYYYERMKYKVELKAGEGIASVTGAGTYYYDATVSLSAEPEEGYELSGFDGDVKEAVFNMPARDVTVTAIAGKKGSGSSSDKGGSSSAKDSGSSSAKDSGSSSAKDSGSSLAKDSGSSSSKTQEVTETVSGCDLIAAADGSVFQVKAPVGLIFNGKKQIPALEIYDAKGEKLVSGTDYKVSVKNGKNASVIYDEEHGSFVKLSGGKAPVAIVKLKGAYKRSKQITVNFDIRPYALSGNDTVILKGDNLTVKQGKNFSPVKTATASLAGRSKKLNQKKDVIITIENTETGRTYSGTAMAQAGSGTYRVLVTGRGNYSATLSAGTFTLLRE